MGAHCRAFCPLIHNQGRAAARGILIGRFLGELGEVVDDGTVDYVVAQRAPGSCPNPFVYFVREVRPTPGLRGRLLRQTSARFISQFYCQATGPEFDNLPTALRVGEIDGTDKFSVAEQDRLLASQAADQKPDESGAVSGEADEAK